MQIFSIEAASQKTGWALHHALSEFHPALDLDGDDGKSSVLVALGNDRKAPQVFDALHRFLKTRAPELLVVTASGSAPRG